MSLFKRIGNLVRSNVNDMLDKAEDPKKILDQTIIDMQEEHKKAKKALLETMTLLKQAEKQTETYRKQSVEWEQKAMIALKGGDDNLARHALTEKQNHEDLANESEAGTTTHRAHVEELKVSLTTLEEKIEDAKKKRDELVARLNAAEMKKKQADIHAGGTAKDSVGDSSAFDTFERMVGKIENQEAEVEARAELAGSKTAELDYELKKKLDAQNADDALAALKAKMAGGGATTSAPASAPVPDAKATAIEDELAKLRAKLESGS
jgi:phage shock protein A